ncbi:gaf domain protein [Flammeovirgaceae bacterium 311]|nr:gaf domain protein [Flammeovirgaceae bacterium 311]
MQITKEQLAPFFKETIAKADRIMNYYFIGNFFFGLFLASFYDTWAVALLMGGISLITYYSAKFILPNTSLYQYVGSAVTAFFVAQFIYQMHGMFEMHFFVFIASLILVAYHNWKLQLPLILLVVVHHASFAYLQYIGMKDIYFTQLDYMTLEAFLFHAALAALIVYLSGYWSYDIRKKTLNGAKGMLLQESQLTKMRKTVSFAEELMKGNLDAELGVDTEDELGKSMHSMREEIRRSKKREQEDRFMNTGLAEISDILRSNQNDVESLCDQVIVSLVKYLNANQGGVFIVEGEQEEAYLTLKSHYAYQRKKHYQNRVEIGEGLVGQACLEKDKIYLTDVPQNYTRITSGLGDATPTSLLIIPLIYNEQVVGVLELASFSEFKNHEQEFLMKVGESIASTIIAVKINERTSELLQNTHVQTEQLRAQEEEMRQNMEELKATQEEMYRKEKELQKQLEEARRKEQLLLQEVEELKKQPLKPSK